MQPPQQATTNPSTQPFARSAAWLVARIELFLFVGVAAACWLLGWRTLSAYANGLQIAGVALLAFGIYSMVGDREQRNAIRAQYGPSAARVYRGQSAQQERALRHAAESFVLEMGLLGGIPLVVGVLLQVLAAQ